MEYLYNDGELWNFMDPLSFEQIAADKTAMGDAAKWLKDDSNENVPSCCSMVCHCRLIHQILWY